MVYRGRVKNGMILLDSGVTLPEGTEVEVRICKRVGQSSETQELAPVFRLHELAVETGIRDLARNADHYLYDHSKVNDGG